MADRPTLSTSEEARELFAQYLRLVARSEAPDFDVWVRARPRCEEELRSLHALWKRLPDSATSLGVPVSVRIRNIVGEEVETRPALDRPDAGAGGEYERIGRYELREEVARGGQGAILRVYDQDLRRHLAMKVVLGSGEQAGARTSVANVARKTLGRFLEEAQVTAQLDHPGIVPVHELGIDDRDGVYFTMKLVKGEDLGSVYEKALREEDGWTRTRVLWVLVKVCEAMAYAHHKGVIHRDLKPANVMVGRFGEVHVMDWGLARVLRPEAETGPGEGPDAPDATSIDAGSPLLTMVGDVIGTPSYMPPEQARGDISSMGPQSDVYSLGAMLYELLAGHPPYMPTGSEVRLLDVLLRSLNEAPEPLSERAPEAPAELVAICEKAMAREPRARYADVGGLAEDLRAFLEDRVVRAHQTGAVAELQKWVRRNRPLALTIAAGILALVLGLAAALVQKGRADANALLAAKREQAAVRAEARATSEAERANAEALRANQEADTASRTTDFLVGLFEVVDPGEARGNTITAREILDRGAARIEAELAGEPGVRSALMDTMGKVYESLGLYEEALPLLERSLSTRVEAYGPEDVLVGETLNHLGKVRRLRAEFAEAEPALRRALELRTEALGPGSVEVAQTRHELGVVLVGLGRLEEAEAELRDSLAVRRELLGRHPDVAETLNALAFCLYDLGDDGSPRALLEESLEIRRETLGNHPDTAEGINDLGVFLYEVGELDAGEELMREALAMKRLLYTDVHPEVALGLNNLAVALASRGKLDAAEELFTEALSIQRELLGPVHPDLAQAIHNVAIVRQRRGDWAGAQELFLESLDMFETVYGPDHPSVQRPLANALDFQRELVQKRLAESGAKSAAHGLELVALSSLLLRAGSADDALDRASEAFDVLGEASDREPWHAAVAEAALGAALAELGSYPEAEGALLASLESLRESRGPKSAEVVATLRSLVRLHEDWEKDDAERYRAQLNDALRKGE